MLSVLAPSLLLFYDQRMTRKVFFCLKTHRKRERELERENERERERQTEREREM
jgi:hypothetical protein